MCVKRMLEAIMMGRDGARLLVSPFPHSPVFLRNICDPLSHIDKRTPQRTALIRSEEGTI